MKSFDLVKEFTDDELRLVTKELNKVSGNSAPATVKMSKNLKRLFDSEKTKDNYWSDQYDYVYRALRFEIVDRFLESVMIKK